MKYLLIILVGLLGMSASAQLDSSIFGLARTASPSSTLLAKINSVSGAVNIISPSSVAGCLNVTGTASAIDPITGRFYFRNCSNQFVSVDMASGAIVASPVISNVNGTAFNAMNFNCLNGKIYGLASRTNPNELFLSQIDPVTGVVTNTSSASVGTCYNATGSTMNTSGNEFYFLDCNNRFTTLDLTTGNILYNPVISNAAATSFGLFKYNCADSTIYGLASANSPNVFYLAKIDPVTGVVTNISSTSVATCANITSSTIDHNRREFYFLNCSGQLITLDLNTGAVINSPNVTTANGLLSVDLFRYNNGCCCGADTKPDLGPDISICVNDSLMLDPKVTASSYLWQDNSSASVYEVTHAGTYSVETITASCRGFDTIQVASLPAPVINLGNDTSLCIGDTLELDPYTNTGSFMWQDNSTSSTYSVWQQGSYWVEVTENGCKASDTIDIAYNPFPHVSLGNDITLCKGQTLILNAAYANASYSWQDSSHDSIFVVSEEGIYTVKVNSYNCVSFDTIIVTLENCNIALEMPDIFTPNNDKVNDNFIPKVMNGILFAHLTIFNRWGKLIYETTDLTTGWDGRIKEGESQAGTYYWLMDYSTMKGETISLHGFLELIR